MIAAMQACPVIPSAMVPGSGRERGQLGQEGGRRAFNFIGVAAEVEGRGITRNYTFLEALGLAQEHRALEFKRLDHVCAEDMRGV